MFWNTFAIDNPKLLIIYSLNNNILSNFKIVYKFNHLFSFFISIIFDHIKNVEDLKLIRQTCLPITKKNFSSQSIWSYLNLQGLCTLSLFLIQFLEFESSVAFSKFLSNSVTCIQALIRTLL